MKRAVLTMLGPALLMAGSTTAANAAIVINGASDEGATYRMNFVGQIAGETEPDISSTLDLTFTDLSSDGRTYSFGYSFTNTSGIESRLRSFGFNVIGGKVTSAAATGAFAFSGSGQNFPEGIGKLGLCFKATSNGTCTGGPGGLRQGQTGTGTFSFRLSAPANSLTIDDVTTRFQSIKGGGYRDASGVGIQAAVPEPSTWLMLILGFAAVGGMMRRQTGQKLRLRFT